MILFDNDEMEVVFKETNTDDVFIVICWSIFKWILCAAEINDRVLVVCSIIVFAYIDGQ